MVVLCHVHISDMCIYFIICLIIITDMTYPWKYAMVLNCDNDHIDESQDTMTYFLNVLGRRIVNYGINYFR